MIMKPPFPAAPPVPPVAVAVFDGSLFGPALAVASGAAPPGVPPFEPVTVTLAAKAGAMPAAIKPSGIAAVTRSRRNNARKGDAAMAYSA
jgi:hypothetical protein